MPHTIFFSWQADTPTRVGRNFVELALRQAARRVAEDTTIEPAVREFEVDRDTQGVGGHAPIVDTILGKIDKAAVFVPDLTFVGTRKAGRPTPNPNVLIEYGWALKSLTWERIIPIMNTAFGEPTTETMPFNMLHRRWPITYHCPEGAHDDTRKQARDGLAKTLERALRDVLGSDEFKQNLPKPPPFPARSGTDGPGRFKSRDEPLGITTVRLPGYGGEEVRLSGGAVCWFRLMPTIDPGRDWSLGELENAATRGHFLHPLSHCWPGYNYMRSHEGFGIYASKGEQPPVTDAVVFAFITGEVWSIDAYWLDAMTQRNAIPPVEADFRRCLDEYSAFLVRLGIAPPFRWRAGMENLKGRGVFIPAPHGQMATFPGPKGKCLLDVLSEDGFYSPGEPAATSLKPFFTKLFGSCGVERPNWLDT
jgi:hypothetical protein